MIDRILKVIPMINSLCDMLFRFIKGKNKSHSTNIIGILAVTKNKTIPLRNVPEKAGNGKHIYFLYM